MARRAVQGYTEKSYYENTTFLGMIATNDPVNEGYFKHLVNLDISDTNQSVAPRKGFLTTGLYFFKEAVYVVGDPVMLGEPVGQGTDVPADNPNGYTYFYLPQYNFLYIWTGDYWSFEASNVYPGPQSGLLESYTYVESSAYWSVTVTNIEEGFDGIVGLSDNCIIFKDANIQSYIVYDFTNGKGYLVDINAYNLENKLLPVTQEIDIDLSSVGIDPTISIHENTKVGHIYDENTVAKILFKATVDGTERTLSCYYRKDAVNLYGVTEPANTLVFEIVNYNQHPTYDTTARNIANENTIIPNPMQTVYTTATRPVGMIDYMGMFYFKAPDGSYPINYIKPNVNYTIRPHFEMNPAHIPLNVVETSDISWAYRFDVWSTSTEAANTIGKDIVYRSPWTKYRRDYTGDPEDPRIFLSDLNNSYTLSGTNREDYHYYGATKVITIVPNEVNCGNAGVANVVYNSTVGTDTPTTVIPSQTELEDLYDSWAGLITDVEDLKSLKDSLSAFGDSVLFYVHDVTEPYTISSRTAAFHYALKTLAGGVKETVSVPTLENESYSQYRDYFLDNSEILDKLNEGYFDNTHVVFRLYPATVRTKREIGSTGEYVHALEFYGLEYWDTVWTAQDTLHVKHNKFKESYLEFSTIENDKYIYGTTVDILKTLGPDMEGNKFFERGYHLRFYMKPYSTDELYESDGITRISRSAEENLKAAWDTIAFQQDSGVRLYAYDETLITNIVEVQPDDPANIQESEQSLVFSDNRLVIWNKNVVYLSEPGRYYYFKADNKFKFNERVYKVIEYKELLLVFTAQHLYAIHRVEEIQNGTDSEGNPVQTSNIYWAKHKVLYNILVDPKYLDVIQVFNDYILFYSADGQMYLIKPSVMIDDETRFTLKYFNKSVNDVLQNYDKYINERLLNYNIDHEITKDDVKVRALVSINFIKIFYSVPGYITYILIYDVINNRYYIYDTITFTEVIEPLYVESGELYITKSTQDGVGTIQLTMPYTELSSNCDMTIINNFNQAAISCLMDTGNLNLNNHLRKRFRDLQVVFKNLSATQVLYNVETTIDDIVDHPFYDEEVQVIDVDGTAYYMTVQKTTNNDLIELVDANQISDTATNAFLYALDQGLFENHNILLDLSNYNSSKLITHRSSILGMGKVVRLKLQFISKGKYKVQRFGIIYKERRV